MEVLNLVGEGKTNREIATALRISVWTVANHRKHICAKLGVHSTAGLVAFAGNPRLAGETVSPDSKTECSIKIDLPQPQGRFRLTYKGQLRQTPGIAEVRIGRTVFYF
jgi:hypothetical protein